MKIEYVTHASLRLLGAKSLLIDPFYFFDNAIASWMCHYPPRRIDAHALGPLDFVFSSHIHADHCHPLTLARLKPQIGRVLLPAERPALQARYAQLGFEDITLLENGQTRRLADDFAVTCFWSDPVDSVLVIESGGTVVVHQNDTRLDDSVIKQIGDRFQIDYAFLCYTMAQDLFPLLLNRPEEELHSLVRDREEAHLAYNVRCVEAWRPRVVVPYSMTMTYFDPMQQHLNGHGRFVPAEFCDRIKARRPEQSTFVIHPGDVIDTATQQLHPADGPYRWGTTLSEYLANIATYVRDAGPGLPRFVAGDASMTAPRLVTLLRERLLHKAIPSFCAGREVALHIVGDGDASADAISINFDARSVDVGPRRGPALLEFTLPASVGDAFLSGSYDPFEILFSLRVKCRYNGAPLSAREESNLLIIMFVTLLAPEAMDLSEDDLLGISWVMTKATRSH